MAIFLTSGHLRDPRKTDENKLFGSNKLSIKRTIRFRMMVNRGKRRMRGDKINGYINKFIGWKNTVHSYLKMTRILQDRQRICTRVLTNCQRRD
jgi:hypothetical protein